MKRAICSATLEQAPEREAMLAWVRTVANGGYSVIGDTIYMTYETSIISRPGMEKLERVIKIFEGYPEHSIKIVDE